MSQELMDAIAMPENLLAAWRAVRGNVPRYRRMTSAGPDGLTLAEFEQDLNAQLDTLRDMLVGDRYQPAPPRLVPIPKNDGGERTIGVLNVADRVAQRAAVQVLARYWEADFLECSFGFRAGRGTPTALAYVRQLQSEGCRWAVEGDIQDCFGSLDHDLMLRRIQRRISDPRVLRLLERWLDCGALSAGLPGDEADPAEINQTGRWAEGARRGVGLVIEALLPGVTGPYGYGSWPDPAPLRDDPRTGPEPRVIDYDAMLQADMARRWMGAALAAGLGWLRPNIGRALYQTGQFFQTPAGRRMLRSGSWAVAGLAGAAAVGALTAWTMRQQAGPAPTGVVQGSPLSPLLANVYLNPFDHRMRDRGHRLVRYADDFVVLAPDERRAESAFNDSLATLRALRLSVNRQKMRIVPPGQKWQFLGEEFQG